MSGIQCHFLLSDGRLSDYCSASLIATVIFCMHFLGLILVLTCN